MKARARLLIGLLAVTATACVVEAGDDDDGGAGGQGLGQPAEDQRNRPASEACSTAPQSGCPSTHTCQYVTLSLTTGCISAGTTPLGTFCFQDADCLPGLRCANNTCREHCNLSDDCTAFGSACKNTPVGPFCTLQCNPSDPGNARNVDGFFACPEDRTCWVDSEAGTGITECYVAGNIPAGQPCVGDGDACAAGLLCVDDVCSRPCILGEASCNCAGLVSEPLVRFPSGMKEVGVCL